jgi:hypothetical protein
MHTIGPMIKGSVLVALALAAASCASSQAQQRRFEQMTAAEHLRAAEEETFAAAREFDIAREKMGERSPLAPPDIAPYEGPVYSDPRPRVLGEANAEAASRHLAQAERHRRAAAALQGEQRIQ